ncbi:MAG: aldo/keto reductase [Anaerolineales bacterium]|nr:aldo/keto reductase [Chloroflexota bacterium]MBL6981899.1 aldo/keto reductase [Anaerolineales bacterium]
MNNEYAIQKRRLGKTEIEITPIGLGVMQFAGGKGMFKMMFPDIPQEQKNLIIKTALDGGINWFDTAELYGRGRSERSLVEALKSLEVPDSEVIIGTKWFPMLRTARSIGQTIDKRLFYLDGYTIDLHMVHQPMGLSSRENEMDAMADLVDAGKIRFVGVSNFGPESMRRSHAALEKRGLPLAVNQVEYSLLRRNIETNGLLDTARELGVTIVAWGPLASGILSGKFHDPEVLAQAPTFRRRRLEPLLNRTPPLISILQEIAEKYQATAAQVALNWLIHFHGESVVAIPGASKVHQAQEAAAAMQFKLSSDEMERLDQVSREIQ